MSVESLAKAALIPLAMAAAGCAGLWGFDPLTSSESSDAGAEGGHNHGFWNGDGGDGAGPFVGTWGCTKTVDISFVEPGGAPPQQASSGGTLAIADNQDGTITSTSVTDAGATCTKRFMLAGKGYAIQQAAESCAFDGLIASYSRGDLTVNGNTLTETGDFSFNGTVQSDGGPVTIAGTASASATCARIGP
jgi:hypothetical protein